MAQVQESAATHQSEPGKDQIECLVKQLYVYPELARNRVRRTVYVVKLDYAVYGSKKRAVEPPPALREQLWDLAGALRLATTIKRRIRTSSGVSVTA